MPTHISIYQGNAKQVPAATAAPTTRENPEYLVDLDKDLQDGDWYYNTVSNALGIRIGSTWYYVEFQLI